MRTGIPQVTDDIKGWANNLTRYLHQSASKLAFKLSGATAAENGIILWDDVNGYPVVSKSNQWRQIVLSNGRYLGGITADQTAAAADTAYALTYTSSIADGIANDGTNPERIVFD